MQFWNAILEKDNAMLEKDNAILDNDNANLDNGNFGKWQFFTNVTTAYKFIDSPTPAKNLP